MIGMNLQQLKTNFAVVNQAKQSANERALFKFGAFVMRRARTSIKQSKNTADAGNPPRGHTGLLRDFIFYVVEKQVGNVIIGPAKINKPIPMILEALEHGGPSLIVSTRGKTKGTLIPIQIHEHPFMQPAFDAEIKKAPELWANQIRA